MNFIYIIKDGIIIFFIFGIIYILKHLYIRCDNNDCDNNNIHLDIRNNVTIDFSPDYIHDIYIDSNVNINNINTTILKIIGNNININNITSYTITIEGNVILDILIQVNLKFTA